MTVRNYLSAAALVLAFATPALALEAKKEIMVDTTPAKAWAAIGDFCAIGSWHPAIEKCVLGKKGGKTIRTLSLKGGGTIVEELVSRDDKKMSYTYTILESPLPVAHYKSTIHVSEMNGTMIDWHGSFDAKGAPDAKAIEVIEGIYQAGLDSLGAKSKS
ncbi:MAG: SRPBCC family protein [Geminicoccaceae bacterium]